MSHQDAGNWICQARIRDVPEGETSTKRSNESKLMVSGKFESRQNSYFHIQNIEKEKKLVLPYSFEKMMPRCWQVQLVVVVQNKTGLRMVQVNRFNLDLTGMLKLN